MDKKNLIDILLDSSSTDAEKDDAAILLGNFNDQDTIDILAMVAGDDSVDNMIRATCGESLALIWLRTSKINFGILGNLEGIALYEALSLIQSQRLDWYNQFMKCKNGR